MENDPSKYFYVAQGMLTIDNVDDAEEMRLTDEAFDILGFTQVKKSEFSFRGKTLLRLCQKGRKTKFVQMHGGDYALWQFAMETTASRRTGRS